MFNSSDMMGQLGKNRNYLGWDNEKKASSIAIDNSGNPWIVAGTGQVYSW